MSIREPAVAGMFYPTSLSTLTGQVKSCFLAKGGPGSLPIVNVNGPRTIVGLVCPHAGYMYSGVTAACAYHRLAEDGLPKVVIILGPNHRSYYPVAALTGHEAWRTPLGDIQVETDVTNKISANFPAAQINDEAHFAEHSLEVQLPFLQYLSRGNGPAVRIVPILIGAAAYTNAVGFVRTLGAAIAEALAGKDAILIASTDFTHYENGESAAAKDSLAISRMLALDEEGLLSTVDSMDISMCGVLPTAISIAAGKKLGATSCRKLTYQNSGDTTGDYSNVVGYAAIEFVK
jgi:MEMO1 family protein